jgi:ankyrin repeat protein
LGAAAAAGPMEVARLLIVRGARLDNPALITLKTPLIEAAQMNRTAMVKLLLDHGADLSARDGMDRTALDWAREPSDHSTSGAELNE